jgi:hypothetical protein
MEKKFEIEDLVDQETPEVEHRCNCTASYILMVIFIIFFLTTATLLVYYQFYIGKSDGKYVFDWSLKKKNTSYLVVKKLEKQNKLIQSRLDSCSSGLGISPGSQSSLFSNPNSGDIYCVQLGAFRSFDFKKYEPSMVNMFVDSENGMNKLIVGGFSEFTDACEFKRDLVNVGIKGVFIIKKVDGKRVTFDSPCP